MIFIHHGDSHFDPNKFEPIRNERECEKLHFDKPMGGLWGTPWNPTGEDEWEHYVHCELLEAFHERLQPSFLFKIKPGAKIFASNDPHEVCRLPGIFRYHDAEDSPDDIDFMKTYLTSFYHQYYIDFEEMIAQGYAGMFVTMQNGMRNVLYSWDVSSILIFDPDAIEEFSIDY